MDLFEAQDFFQKMYPGKQVSFEFDDKCHRKCEFIMTDGSPNLTHHVECNRVKVSVEGLDPQYVPIAPHRLNVLWSDLKSHIMDKKDIFFHDNDLKAISSLSDADYDSKIAEYQKASGLTKSAIEKKINDYKKKSN